MTHQLSILFVVFNLRPFKIIIDLNTFPNHVLSVSVCINFESRKFPLTQTKAELFCYSALLQRVGFNQKPLTVLQIKEIELSYIDLDRSFCQFIGKSISNDEKQILWRCEITETGFEALIAQLGDKQVIKDLRYV